MECEIKYFGLIGEKLEISSERININDLTVDGLKLKEVFIKRYPILKDMTFQIAINGKIKDELTEEQNISIALLPPFAGG
jgi:molybdopterin converting factor small subunit